MDSCKHDIRYRYYTELQAPSYYLRAECVHCGEAGKLIAVKIEAGELEIKQRRAFESAENKFYGSRAEPKTAGLAKAKG